MLFIASSLPGEGNGNPLQYSCLGNPMDEGAWWVTVHGLTESDRTEQLTHIHYIKFTILTISKCTVQRIVTKLASTLLQAVKPIYWHQLSFIGGKRSAYGRCRARSPGSSCSKPLNSQRLSGKSFWRQDEWERLWGVWSAHGHSSDWLVVR